MAEKIIKTKRLRHEPLGAESCFDLSSLVNKFETQLSAIALSRGKIIGATMSARMPRSYFGNPLCIYDILNNLASFSLFHLDDDGIFFKLHADTLGGGRYRISIIATTTGFGIPYYQLRTVFHPASQTGGPGNSSLYIAKTLTFLLGGDLTIENTFGWGTRYNISLIMEDGIMDSVFYNEKLAS
jgi:hypothetical protein